jgi:hypothetical protein
VELLSQGFVVGFFTHQCDYIHVHQKKQIHQVKGFFLGLDHKKNLKLKLFGTYNHGAMTKIKNANRFKFQIEKLIQK